MKSLFVIGLLLLTFNTQAQSDHKYVKLIEEKLGKRVTLFAKNTDSIAYDVFLKVDTKDYRRSSSRPVLKNIPANSKTKLITLIQLTKTEGNYKTLFIVNEVARALKFRKDKQILEFKLDDAIHDKNVTLFTNNKCNICNDTKHILKNNNIAYTELNIDKDSINYIKFSKTLKTYKKGENTGHMPMLKVDDNLFNNIKTIEDFTKALRQVYDSK